MVGEVAKRTCGDASGGGVVQESLASVSRAGDEMERRVLSRNCVKIFRKLAVDVCQFCHYSERLARKIYYQQPSQHTMPVLCCPVLSLSSWHVPQRKQRGSSGLNDVNKRLWSCKFLAGQRTEGAAQDEGIRNPESEPDTLGEYLATLNTGLRTTPQGTQMRATLQVNGAPTDVFLDTGKMGTNHMSLCPGTDNRITDSRTRSTLGYGHQEFQSNNKLLARADVDVGKDAVSNAISYSLRWLPTILS